MENDIGIDELHVKLALEHLGILERREKAVMIEAMKKVQTNECFKECERSEDCIVDELEAEEDKEITEEPSPWVIQFVSECLKKHFDHLEQCESEGKKGCKRKRSHYVFEQSSSSAAYFGRLIEGEGKGN